MSCLDLKDHVNKLLGKANRAASNLKSEIPRAQDGNFSSICKDLQDIVNAIHEAHAVSDIIKFTGMDVLVFSQVQDETTFAPKPFEGQMHELCTTLLEAGHQETLKNLSKENVCATEVKIRAMEAMLKETKIIGVSDVNGAIILKAQSHVQGMQNCIDEAQQFSKTFKCHVDLYFIENPPAKAPIQIQYTGDK